MTQPEWILDLSEQSPVGASEWNDEACYFENLDLKRKLVRAPSLAKKSVAFAEFSQVFYVEHVDDISEAEKEAAWYTPEEYGKFKRDVKLTLFLMKNRESELLSSDEYTARGLEYRTTSGKWARLRNKQDAYDAVLTEQEYQWNRGSCDEESIRRAYRNVSVRCAELAAGLAMKDREDLLQCL